MGRKQNRAKGRGRGREKRKRRSRVKKDMKFLVIIQMPLLLEIGFVCRKRVFLRDQFWHRQRVVLGDRL
jgi:hypothetical protein